MIHLSVRSACRVAGALALVLSQFIAASVVHASVGCPADVDNDHQVNIDDLFVVLDNWGGSVTIDTLFSVLGAWGPCPCEAALGCLPVDGLWCEDWQPGNYARWTSGYYDWSSCAFNGLAIDNFASPSKSHVSQVVCSAADSHRGYGGLRFQGDTVLPSFSVPSNGGIEAPFGVVVTFHSWLAVPYTFSPTRWLSLMTVTDDCSNNWNNVVTLNIDDASMRLKPVHVSTVQYAPNAPAFPLERWNRTTVYLNYYTGSMHVWQNGVKVVSATFTRPSTDMCQWHFGLYASGPNDDITLYEDDLSIVKLLAPLADFTNEPWFDSTDLTCLNMP